MWRYLHTLAFRVQWKTAILWHFSTSLLQTLRLLSNLCVKEERRETNRKVRIDWVRCIWTVKVNDPAVGVYASPYWCCCCWPYWGVGTMLMMLLWRTVACLVGRRYPKQRLPPCTTSQLWTNLMELAKGATTSTNRQSLLSFWRCTRAYSLLEDQGQS